MSMNILNDISKVYAEQVASKPDFLDLDKDGNKKEPMKKAAKEVEAPKERLKTDRDMFNIPKDEQKAARERLLAKARAKREKMKEELDPVGQEDSDIDNDGDTDSSDKYLHNRRKAIGKAISKKKSVKESKWYDPMDDDEFDHDEAEENRGVSGKNNPKGGKSLVKKKKPVKEGFSNWRQDLSEVMDDIEANKEIKEKKVNNKIKINPEMKEAVEQLGGELIEMVELDEGMTMKDFKQQRSRQKQKEKRAADKIAPNRRKDIHTDRYSPERAARHRANVDPDFEGNDERNYPGGKLNPKKVRKAKALGELGEEVLDEKAVSKSQQRFMGMVYAAKKGETPASPEVAKAAKSMSKKEAKKFAKTKHEGLPDKVDEAVVGGSAPNLPAKVVKFVDELPQNLQKTFTKTKPTQKPSSNPTVNKEELEVIDERRREDKGTPRPAEPSAAFKAVSKMMRQQTGKPAGQRKKVPGKKPPKAGEYGAPQSPAQKVKLRKAQQQRSQEWQQDTKGT